MQSLYSPEKYPHDLADQIERLSPMAIAIANRWMLGWPGAVNELIESEEYLDALKFQEEQERRAQSQSGLSHLSSWEKTEVMGLTQAPPGAGL